MLKILTIAGSDPSGGAGIQADLKTIAAHGHYGMSVITALTAQNTLGVHGVHPIPAVFVRDQLEAVMSDIQPDAIKIGMVYSAEIIQILYDVLMHYPKIPLVLDPVMISTSGRSLLDSVALLQLQNKLMPLATLMTPNIPEAECLWGYPINSTDDMLRAAKDLHQQLHCPVLIKGGHLKDAASDLLYDAEHIHWYHGPKLANPNTHGTGCTLSSALACRLAEGFSLVESMTFSKAYLTKAIQSGLNLGQGNGPLNHLTAD